MNIEVFYPGYTKKAVTFTIDDGYLAMDEKFMSYLAPAGFKGTFNLCSDRITPENKARYVEFYRNYEVSNHVKYHPFVFRDDTDYPIDKKGEPFDASTADPTYVYPVEGKSGFYWRRVANGWRQFVSVEDFKKYSDIGRQELEQIFGEGTVGGFVWPYGQQNSAAVIEHLKGCGYYGLRATGNVRDTTGFALPADRMAWSYNATHADILKVMEKFEAYPDDGELKFFSLGVHSVDFEHAEKWDDLATFAEKYGNRPGDFWYATVGEIFAYADAAKLLVCEGDSVRNPSDKTLYLKIDGKEVELAPGCGIQA